MPSLADIIGQVTDNPDYGKNLVSDPNSNAFATWLLTGKNINPDPYGIETLLAGKEDDPNSWGVWNIMGGLPRQMLRGMDVGEAQSRQFWGQAFANAQRGRNGTGPRTLLQPLNEVITPDIPQEILDKGPFAVNQYVVDQTPEGLPRTIVDLLTGMSADPTMIASFARAPLTAAAKNGGVVGTASKIAAPIATALDVSTNPFEATPRTVGLVAQGLKKPLEPVVAKVNETILAPTKAAKANAMRERLGTIAGSGIIDAAKNYVKNNPHLFGGSSWDDVRPRDDELASLGIDWNTLSDVDKTNLIKKTQEELMRKAAFTQYGWQEPTSEVAASSVTKLDKDGNPITPSEKTVEPTVAESNPKYALSTLVLTPETQSATEQIVRNAERIYALGADTNAPQGIEDIIINGLSKENEVAYDTLIQSNLDWNKFNEQVGSLIRKSTEVMPEGALLSKDTKVDKAATGVALPWADASAFSQDLAKVLNKYNPDLATQILGIVKKTVGDGQLVGAYASNDKFVYLMPLASREHQIGGQVVTQFQIPRLTDEKLVGVSPTIRKAYPAGRWVDADTARGFYRDVVLPHEIQHGIDSGLFGKYYPDLKDTVRETLANTRGGALENAQTYKLFVGADELNKLWHGLSVWINGAENAPDDEELARVTYELLGLDPNEPAEGLLGLISRFEMAAEPQIKQFENVLKDFAVRAGAAPNTFLKVGRAYRNVMDTANATKRIGIEPTFYVELGHDNPTRLLAYVKALASLPLGVEPTIAMTRRVSYGELERILQEQAGLSDRFGTILKKAGITDAEVLRNAQYASREGDLPAATWEMVQQAVDQKRVTQREADFLKNHSIVLKENVDSKGTANLIPQPFVKIDLGTDIDKNFFENIDEVAKVNDITDYRLTRELGEDGEYHNILEARTFAQLGDTPEVFFRRFGTFLKDMEDAYGFKIPDAIPVGYAINDIADTIDVLEGHYNGLAERLANLGRNFDSSAAIDSTGRVKSASAKGIITRTEGAADSNIDARIGAERYLNPNSSDVPKEAQPLIPLSDPQLAYFRKHWDNRNKDGAHLFKHLRDTFNVADELRSGNVSAERLEKIQKEYKGFDLTKPEDVIYAAVDKASTDYATRVLGIKPSSQLMRLIRWNNQLIMEGWLSTPKFLILNTVGAIGNYALHRMNPFYSVSKLGQQLNRYGITDAPREVTEEFRIEGMDRRDSPSAKIPKVARMLVGAALGLSGGPVTAAIGAGIGYVFPYWSKLIRESNSSLERMFRTSAWIVGKNDYLDKNVDRFLKTNVNIPESISKAIKIQYNNSNASISPSTIYQIAKRNGALDEQAMKITREWQSFLEEGDKAGIDLSNHLNYNYSDRRKIDDALGIVFPFVTWPTRNLIFYAEHMLERPVETRLIAHAAGEMEQANQDKGLTARFDRAFNISPILDPASRLLTGQNAGKNLYGTESDIYVNPSNLLSIVSQFRPQSNRIEDESDSPINRGVQGTLDTLGAFGFALRPQYTDVLNIAGILGDQEFTDVLPFSRTIRNVSTAAGMPVEPEPWNDWRQELKTLVTGETPATISGSSFKDYQINKKLSELSVRNTGKPNDPVYVLAMTNPSSPLYKVAEQEVLRENLQSGIVSLLNPVNLKELPREEELIRSERKKVADQLPPAVRDETGAIVQTNAQKEANSLVYNQHPLSRSYSNVSDAPNVVTLQGKLEQYYNIGTEYDRAVYDNIVAVTQDMDDYTRYQYLAQLRPEIREAYTRQMTERSLFKQQNPDVANYLSWVGSIRNTEGSDNPEALAVDTSVARYMKEFNKPTRSGEGVQTQQPLIGTKPLTEEDKQIAALDAKLTNELTNLGNPTSLTTKVVQRSGNDMAKAYLSWLAQNKGRSKKEFLKLWLRYRVNSQ